MMINGSALKALRSLLFFSRQEAATLVAASPSRPRGVSERAWRQWEAGDLQIPGDITEKMLFLVDWRFKAVGALKAQIEGAAQHLGPSQSIPVVWYEKEGDWTSLKGRTPIFWRPQQSAIAEILALNVGQVKLVRFDGVAYAQWLGNRVDCETERAHWAAQI